MDEYLKTLLEQIRCKKARPYAAGSDRYVFHVVIGLAVMMILYLLDYTVLARFSKIIAVILLFACLVTLLGGYQLNGARYFIVLPGGRGISMQTLMLFYVPIYGAILYKYHGWGYKGLMRAIIWMIAPVILVYAMPALMTACEKKEDHVRNLGWFSGYACGNFWAQVSEKQPDRISDRTYTGYFFRWW